MISGARVKVVFSMEGLDPNLVQAVRQGAYVVDPRAVAEAILRRRGDRLSDVLEALERDSASIEVAEDDPGTPPDAA
jgi:hypothetical protein